MKKFIKLNLTIQILISTFVSISIGSLINYFSPPDWFFKFIIHGVLEIGGTLFLSSLKLLVIPLIFVSLVVGVSSLKSVSQLGRIGAKSLSLFLATTFIAISLALALASLVNFNNSDFHMKKALSSYTPPPSPSLVEMISKIFPSNPIKSMAEGETLQVIIFAILFGYALTITPRAGKPLVEFFENLNQVLLDLIVFLIQFSPLGVFCLLTKTFSTQGLGVILPLGQYFLTVTLALFIHGFIFYGLLLKMASGISPFVFFKKFYKVSLFAFSTSSSNSTIPINLNVTHNDLGASKNISSFTIPLGATINMDGTAIMQGVATIFISQVYNIDLNFLDLALVVITATLASIGTAGVPGVGLVMLAMVLQQVNLPVEGIGLIIGIDRLLDMMRTAVNVTGDSVVTLIVAKSENEWDEEKFYSK